jgi:hypothetical protein
MAGYLWTIGGLIFIKYDKGRVNWCAIIIIKGEMLASLP